MSSTKTARSAPNVTSKTAKDVDWVSTPGGLWPVVIHSLLMIIVVVNAIL